MARCPVTDLGWLDAIEALRGEASVAARPGQWGRLDAIADRLEAAVRERDAALARVEALAEDLLGTYDCYDDDDMAVKEHIVPAIRAALADPKETE